MIGAHCKIRPKCLCVRCSHTALTLGVLATLLWKDTAISAALQVTPDLWYGLLYLALVFTSLALYLAACFTNPGFVPIPDKVLYRGESESEDEEQSMLQDQQQQVKRRKCGFCGIKQPMRARHCEDCKRCVQKFDHHCPWLDTCVGERNHKFFWLFCVTKSVLVVWTAVIVWQAFRYQPDWEALFIYNWVFLLDLGVVVLAGFVVISLASFHSYLMVTNTTTWEVLSRHRITYLKYFKDDYNPFNEGSCRNVYSFLCTWTARRWDLLYMQAASKEGVV